MGLIPWNSSEMQGYILFRLSCKIFAHWYFLVIFVASNSSHVVLFFMFILVFIFMLLWEKIRWQYRCIRTFVFVPLGDIILHFINYDKLHVEMQAHIIFHWQKHTGLIIYKYWPYINWRGRVTRVFRHYIILPSTCLSRMGVLQCNEGSQASRVGGVGDLTF